MNEIKFLKIFINNGIILKYVIVYISFSDISNNGFEESRNIFF